jgi:hypothetical protein
MVWTGITPRAQRASGAELHTRVSARKRAGLRNGRSARSMTAEARQDAAVDTREQGRTNRTPVALAKQRPALAVIGLLCLHRTG